MASQLGTLVAHLRWSDAKARDSLASLDEASPEFERARVLFAHVAAAEHIWLARLNGRPESYPVWPDLPVKRTAEIAGDAADELARLVESLGEEDRTRVVTYRNSSGKEFGQTLEDILLHLVLHGMYHRGQIAQLVSGGGGEPASTDYIAFLRGSAAPSHAGPVGPGTEHSSARAPETSADR